MGAEGTLRMSQWYLSKNGQALGPLSEDKVIALIHSGEVTPLDLVYQAGATEWLPVSEVPQLFQHIQNEEKDSNPSGGGDRSWVLLKRTETEKGKEYKQLGPFSETQVLGLIDSGEIRFSDFAWKEGMESWGKISEIRELSQPLPSSTSVDASLYEKTDDDHAIAKSVDAVGGDDIETFQREQQTVTTPPVFMESDGDDELEEVGPEASTSFEEDENSEVSLWSLDPPLKSSEKAAMKTPKSEEAPVSDEPARVVAAAAVTEPIESSLSDENTVEQTSVKEKQGDEDLLTPPPFLNTDKALRVAAGLVIAIGVFFVYTSFHSDGEKSEVGAFTEEEGGDSLTDQNAFEPETPRPPEVMVAAPTVPPPPAVVEENKGPAPKVKPAAKVVSSKTRPSAKVGTASAVKRVEKRNRINKQLSVVRSSKKNKSQVKAKGKAVKSVGSQKQQSFYKQRDRLALFYSSLKAETLAVDIARQYKKIGKNKSAWSRYYKQWQKKVRLSLAKDIREFPKRSEKYAYPKVLASFKKDYNLFYKYGALFDSKVKGSRAPSGVPKDMKSVFSRYKKQAQSLGR